MEWSCEKHVIGHVKVTCWSCDEAISDTETPPFYTALIDNSECMGREDDVSSQLDTLREQWDALLTQISEKTRKLLEANQQQQFNEAAKDLDFWLGGVEAQLSSEEVGRDLAGTQSLLKKHQLVEADITAHEVCFSDLLRAYDPL